MSPHRRSLLWACLALSVACRPVTPTSRAGIAETAARAQRIGARLAAVPRDQSGAVVLARWILPPELREVSGLALTSDGRLLAHDDERGRIVVVDPLRGVLLKQFTIGTSAGAASADFEGITVVGALIYLVASNGTLYEFPEGADDERVRFRVHDTHLGKECEFEGVAFDSVAQEFLLPCKSVGTARLHDQLVVYRWSERDGDDVARAPITIPLREVIGSNPWKGLHPSDITIDPKTGHYILVAAQERALVELTPAGKLVRAEPLPGKHHQAEGVAIMPDGILIVSDEATNRSASLTLYRWRSAPAMPVTP